MAESGSDANGRQDVTRKGKAAKRRKVPSRYADPEIAALDAGGLRRKPSAASLRRQAWEQAESAARVAAGGSPGEPLPGGAAKPGSDLADAVAALGTGVEQTATSVQLMLESPGNVLDLLTRARNKAREYSEVAVEVIATVMNDEKQSGMVRLKAAQAMIEIAEKDGRSGKKRIGEMSPEELRALADSLRARERSIDGEATVVPDANPLSQEPRQPDDQSGRPGDRPDALPVPPSPPPPAAPPPRDPLSIE